MNNSDRIAELEAEVAKFQMIAAGADMVYRSAQGEITRLKNENLRLSEKLGRCRVALDRIITGVPAVADGGCFVEHHDENGNYVGTEQVDPLAVISCMVGVASDCLTSLSKG